MPPARAGIHPSAVVGAGATIDPSAEIGPLAVIGEGAEIGPRCRIGALAVIGPGVVLGPDCRIGAHASLSHALLGARVYVYPGARIGQEGFGFAIGAEGFLSVPQLCRVILEDDVEVGANATIDRGSLQDTVIGAGSRLDNLVQIGHNVRLGRGCVIVAQAGISGSTILEDHVMMGPQAGLTGHLRIGRMAKIGAQAGVMADVDRRDGGHRQPGAAAAGVLARICDPAPHGPRGRQEGWRQGRWRQGRWRRGGCRQGCRRQERRRWGRRRQEWVAQGDGHGLTAMDASAIATTGAPAPGTVVEAIDIARIMQAIPHRYPFLMIDRVVDLVTNQSAIGVKNVSVNESFFQGHFPNHPVMPGVLIIEAMAQTAAILVVETLGPDAAGRVVYFMSVEGAKFRRPVVPGDQLRVHCTKLRNRGNVWKFSAVARVDGSLGRRGHLYRDDHGPRGLDRLSDRSCDAAAIWPEFQMKQTVTGRSKIQDATMIVLADPGPPSRVRRRNSQGESPRQ